MVELSLYLTLRLQRFGHQSHTCLAGCWSAGLRAVGSVSVLTPRLSADPFHAAHQGAYSTVSSSQLATGAGTSAVGHSH